MLRNQGRPVRAFFLIASVIAAAIAPQQGWAARGVSPYLPLNIAPEIERSIERVMVLADRPILTRPIAAAAVFDALDIACQQDAVACAEVRRYLDGYMKNYGLAFGSIELAIADDRAVALPNRHGMSSASRYQGAAQIYWQPADKLLLSGGVIVSENATAPTGSMISFGTEYFQADIGYRDHWYSPMTDSAMLISTQAETMPSLTISNYSPLTKLNFRYEAFMARMSYSSNIEYGDGFTAGEPRLVGLHLSITPFPGFTVGANRLMQYGGGERSDSFSDLLNAFFRPSKYDNTGSMDDPAEEFGNQTASLTARYINPGEYPFSVYFEYAGEDTSTNNNLRLGNTGTSIGLYLPSLLPRFDLTVELSEWQNAWYVSGVYGDGLTNHGNVIGHWGADWREFGDAVGAQSIMARAQWRLDTGGRLEGTYRALANESYTAPAYTRAGLLSLRYSHPWRTLLAGAALDIGRDSFGEDYSRLAIFLRY